MPWPGRTRSSCVGSRASGEAPESTEEQPEEEEEAEPSEPKAEEPKPKPKPGEQPTYSRKDAARQLGKDLFTALLGRSQESEAGVPS